MIDDANPSESQTGSAHPGEVPRSPAATQVTDGAMNVTDTAMQMSEIDRLETEMESLDAGLERIQSGTYGTCNVCSAVIDDSLLKADPLLATCPAHVRLN